MIFDDVLMQIILTVTEPLFLWRVISTKKLSAEGKPWLRALYNSTL